MSGLLNPDFHDILSIFNDRGVDYLLVGAYALAVHGFPRATGDIDLWILTTRDNASRVYASLAEFGAPMEQLSEQDFVAKGIVFQIGVAPRRVDVLTSIDGVEFEDAWARRLEIDIEGLRVPVLSREDLIKNKRASGRPKDLADLAWLETSSS